MVTKGFIKRNNCDYYLVNQNGFNNALYDYFEANDREKKDIRAQAAECYPKSYPCIMHIDSYNTFEGGRLFAKFDYNLPRIKQLAYETRQKIHPNRHGAPI